MAGLFAALWKGRWLACSFLALTPLFYIWSLHSSKTPIHVPTLWPFSYYNSRYGIAMVVLMAFAAGGVLLLIPKRLRAIGLTIPLLSVFPWLTMPAPLGGIVWKESEVNSTARRAWTDQGAAYLREHFHRGDRILIEFGDVIATLGRASIPLKEAVHEGNGPAWFANTMPSGLVRQARWAVAQQGDLLSGRIAQARSYSIVRTFSVKGAPPLLIYERRDSGEVH
jgi:hypothetical protein